MTNEDEPTTAAEMELVSVVDDVLDDAWALELLAMTYEARCAMRAAMARYLRGEMPDAEWRGWLTFIDETCPMIEAMIDRNRERNND